MLRKCSRLLNGGGMAGDICEGGERLLGSSGLLRAGARIVSGFRWESLYSDHRGASRTPGLVAESSTAGSTVSEVVWSARQPASRRITSPTDEICNIQRPRQPTRRRTLRWNSKEMFVVSAISTLDGEVGAGVTESYSSAPSYPTYVVDHA